jgi:hypothetical protein
VIKALSLLLGLGKLLGEGEPTSLYRWFFSAVAMAAGVLLARAGWGTQLSSED